MNAADAVLDTTVSRSRYIPKDPTLIGPGDFPSTRNVVSLVQQRGFFGNDDEYMPRIGSHNQSSALFADILIPERIILLNEVLH